jgi:predicted house-cleaning noncanonical NTP pyrophosphatase (MazG superfamily)
MKTPRTDAERRRLKKAKAYPPDPVSAEFARQFETELANALELIREIRDGEVNAEDEADKFLRDHVPSKLAAMTDLADRLAEALKNCKDRAMDKSIETHPDEHTKGCIDDIWEWAENALAAYRNHKK